VKYYYIKIVGLSNYGNKRYMK